MRFCRYTSSLYSNLYTNLLRVQRYRYQLLVSDFGIHRSVRNTLILQPTRCAKTYCSGDTSFQSQLLDSFDNCTSFFSNPAAVPTTEVALTSPISQSSSTAVPRASNTPISTSTTASSASNTSSTTGTTSAPGTTTSVATSQASSTTSTSKAAANLVLASNGGLGRFLAFVAGMAALI
jgi:hypothetical protein